jgi:N-acetyl-gamma-glutamyl-phosphate reductase
MVVEVPLPLAAMPGAASAQNLLTALVAHYANEPLISVHEGEMPAELLIHQGAAPSDRMHLTLAVSPDGTQARAIATIDNLCKGASGAAVQSLNIMAGLEETAGLRL